MNKHECKFTKTVKEKLTLNAGKKVARDTIYYRQCECGKKKAFDLERKKIN